MGGKILIRAEGNRIKCIEFEETVVLKHYLPFLLTLSITQTHTHTHTHTHTDDRLSCGPVSVDTVKTNSSTVVRQHTLSNDHAGFVNHLIGSCNVSREAVPSYHRQTDRTDLLPEWRWWRLRVPLIIHLIIMKFNTPQLYITYITLPRMQPTPSCCKNNHRSRSARVHIRRVSWLIFLLIWVTRDCPI